MDKMFFFKNRNRYNGTVNEILTDGYQIVTSGNPKFPGSLAYLGMIDKAWANKFTEQEAALFIAALYYSGLRREGHHAEARTLASHISVVGQKAFSAGAISMERLAVFMSLVERANQGSQ